ncbi:MAG: LLM class F420-dependent oxidoreductase [Gammaproteobacteria bacterium]|nr:LLM class F420-dependent oxidoreductase [Gammaproteobacteria bacterium]
MKISISAHYSHGSIAEQAEELRALEKAGADCIWVAESYSFDSISALGYLAAVTEKVTLASGIVNIYSRTPALLAMTAAGMDAVSKGRFMLGLGASGPQVVEGFHGVPYDAPLTRMREVMDICRAVWRREDKLTHQGEKYRLPLPASQGTGLGKPLKIINRPVREAVPIALATLGAKSVAMTAEKAEAWLPAFFNPQRADKVWGNALKEGMRKRAPELPPLQVFAGGAVGIGEGLEAHRDLARPRTALYVGGMGAKDKNFYNQIFRQYGYEKEAQTIQELYLSGRKSEAEAQVPQRYLDETSLIGPEGYVRDQIQAYREAGVTCLSASFIGTTTAQRVRQCDELRNLLEKI